MVARAEVQGGVVVATIHKEASNLCLNEESRRRVCGEGVGHRGGRVLVSDAQFKVTLPNVY